jgi:hypothetical protein
VATVVPYLSFDPTTAKKHVFEGGLLLNVLDLGGRQQPLELGQGAVDDDPALVQDRDPVGELFGLLQVLGGEQHGRAARGEFPDGPQHLDARLRVQPGRRLVEEDDRWIPDEAHRDVQAAAHATGVRRRPPGARLGQREAPQQVRRDHARVLEVPQPGDQNQILPQSTPRSTRSCLYDFSRPRTWITRCWTWLVVAGMLMPASMKA